MPSSETVGLGEGSTDKAEKLVRADLGRAMLCLIPLLVAAWVAITRCQDYRHDVYDVTVGSLLGWTVAYWSYRRYWPHVSSPRCDEPYAGPPAAGEEETAPGYGRLRDEEAGLGSSLVGTELRRVRA
jgi:diacylglycerol diphosphate phosphatase/phosphatidate phosphatase